MPPKVFRKKSALTYNEFTVLGVFAAVVLALLVCGAIFAVGELRGKQSAEVVRQEVVAPPAPTEEEYVNEAADVLTPFLTQAANVRPEHFASDTGVLLDLVTKTQERLLRVRVPADYRDAHLAFVLLLDQWKRALTGSTLDQKTVLEVTSKTVEKYPWALKTN